jgi:hypothetical protein
VIAAQAVSAAPWAFRLPLVIAVLLAAAVGLGPTATYCSPSGDVCYGVFVRRHRVYLKITTAARYFTRYRLCVRLLPTAGGGAEHALRCGSFPVFRGGAGTWVSTINYARQYPITRPGRYRVTWKAGQPLGPSLTFRLPVR